MEKSKKRKRQSAFVSDNSGDEDEIEDEGNIKCYRVYSETSQQGSGYRKKFKWHHFYRLLVSTKVLRNLTVHLNLFGSFN